MLIQRYLEKEIIARVKDSNKVLVIYGPRQVGKTTLIQSCLAKLSLKTLTVNADEQVYIDILSSRNLKKLRLLVAGYQLLFIDEAQRIPEIGINLKILHDQMPDLRLIVTGSSSLDLASKVTEPLTGRKLIYTLFPVAFMELAQERNLFELTQTLEEHLVFGSYPRLYSLPNQEDKRSYLYEVSRSYLYKDVLELGLFREPAKVVQLLKLLAYQIGSEVSISELGTQLSLSRDTVRRYIDLLEESFVVFRLGGFSRNLRKEVSKMDKIYFYDPGIRNAVIDNFNLLSQRNDVGQLWENFLIVERKKMLSYTHEYPGTYFWRTHTGAELDYVEESGGKLAGFEFKYSGKGVRVPKTWLATYKDSSFTPINGENFLEFILPRKKVGAE